MGRSSVFLFVAVAVVLSFAVGPVGAQKHIVGGKRGHWAPNVNFTEWAAGERFYVGDWLVFFYEKGYYDVFQVNATGYEQCSAENPIRNYSRGNSYAFQLNHTGSYYFICSRGQCWNGMKVAINVTDIGPQPLPSPPSLQPSSSFSSAVISVGLTVMLLIVTCAVITALPGFLD